MATRSLHRSPDAEAAGEMPVQLLLQTGPGKPSGFVDRAIHLSVLKELLGPEIRGIIRAELASANALSPDGPSRTKSLPRIKGADSTPATPAGLCNTVCHSDLYEEVDDSGTEDEVTTETDQLVVASARPAPGGCLGPPTIATAPADAEGSMVKPLLPAVGRQVLSPAKVSDMTWAEGQLLDDISATEELATTRHAADERLQSHWLAKGFPSLATYILRLDGMIAQLGSDGMEAPEPSNKLSQIADSCWFQTAGNIATLLNCAFLTWMANWNFTNHTKEVPDIVSRVDDAFLGFFSLELAARLARHRQYYFVNSNYFMNWIDFIIVLGGLAEVALGSIVGSLQFLRHLRALRLLKVLRLFRVLRMFRTLQVVLDSLANTLTELVWCAVTLLLIEFMFALMLVMRAGAVLRDHEEYLTEAQKISLTERFGSISTAVFNLFKVSMGAGDWFEDYKILAPTGLLSQAIYLVFVVFAFIAVLNVILGVFVEKAMKNLAPTREEQAQQHAAEEMEMVDDVKALCMEGDLDANGKLCLEEWHEIFSQGKIAAYMDSKGFKTHDLRTYFKLCAANSNGEIDIEAFVRGCYQLKGPASCFDVKTMLVELHRLSKYLEGQFGSPRRRSSQGLL